MTAILDVGMEVFQSFRRRNPVFFWTETPSQFVLLKPYNDAWARTVVNKSGVEKQDFLWREQNLSSQNGAFYVERVTNLDLESKLEQILAEVKKSTVIPNGDNR